jgi:hypothetical protein
LKGIVPPTTERQNAARNEVARIAPDSVGRTPPNGPTGRQDDHDDTTITKDPGSFFVVNVAVAVTFVKSRRRFHARHK